MKYKPLTPPASNYPIYGKTSLVIADIIARYFGLEKPKVSLKLVNINELR